MPRDTALAIGCSCFRMGEAGLTSVVAGSGTSKSWSFILKEDFGGAGCQGDCVGESCIGCFGEHPECVCGGGGGRVDVCTCVCVCVHACMRACARARVCVHVCMCVKIP